MKKIFYILTLAISLISCQEDVTFNNPTFEGYKDNQLWRSKGSIANYNFADSTLTVIAYKGLEEVELKAYPVLTATDASGIYLKDTIFELGVNTKATARYKYAVKGINHIFETGEEIGVGEFKIENTVTQNPGTMSATFRFDAPKKGDTSEFPETVNFQYGVIYQIPINFIF